jgi:hypothetical protein
MSYDSDLDLFYADAELVTRAGGSFKGFLSATDITAFESPQVGDYTLQYPSSVTLARSELVSINGTPYRVAEHPRRIGDGRELMVGLSLERA